MPAYYLLVTSLVILFLAEGNKVLGVIVLWESSSSLSVNIDCNMTINHNS